VTKVKCQHCEAEFQVEWILKDAYPMRKGMHCIECGEYNPYAWDLEEKINWNEPNIKGNR